MRANVGNVWCILLALVVAACTSGSAPANDQTPIVGTNADHWTNVGQVALIHARDGDAYLSASCYYGATMALYSTAKVSDWPEARSLAFGFDGAAPVAQAWLSRDYSSPRWGFETSAHSTDFLNSLDAMRQHREVEAVVTEAGKEVLRVHFSLAGAGDALARAFEDCPPHLDGAATATTARWGILRRATTGNMTVAGILRPGGDPAIELLCDVNRKSVGILVWPKQPLPAPAERSRLALIFDGEEQTQNWRAGLTGFELWQDARDFNAVIESLRTHQSVTVAIRSPGQVEESRETLPLLGVSEALDRVFRDCHL